MNNETKTPTEQTAVETTVTAPAAEPKKEAKAENSTAKPKAAKPKAKPIAKKETPAEAAPSMLENVGKEAIKRHGYDSVFVTSDGTAFPQECDARNHATNLQDKEIIKVTKQ